MSRKDSSFFSIQTKVWSLVILRIAIGYWFLKFGYAKYTGMLEGTKLTAQLAGLTKDMPPGWFPWYQSFLTDVVASHASFFAYLILFGELAVGAALVIGFLTRPALLAGMFMNLSYHLASGYKPGASGFVNMVFICAELSLIFTPVGRCLGVDYFLHRIFPRLRFI